MSRKIKEPQERVLLTVGWLKKLLLSVPDSYRVHLIVSDDKVVGRVNGDGNHLHVNNERNELIIAALDEDDSTSKR